MGIYSGCNPLNLGQKVPVILHQVCLGQQNHRGCPGLPGKGQIPLQTLRIEIHVQGLHDEHIVKVGCHRLIPWHRPRRPAGEGLNIDGREYIVNDWSEDMGVATIALGQTVTM